MSAAPIQVLNALFPDEAEDQSEGIAVFDHHADHRSNPADVIPSSELIVWCDEKPQVRYRIAASIITFARPSEETGLHVWSGQAIDLLSHAPSANDVLMVFIGRFRPSSWSGSRASLMEANARLLDDLHPHVSSADLQLAQEEKRRLAQEIDSERRSELKRDRSRDERFE